MNIMVFLTSSVTETLFLQYPPGHFICIYFYIYIYICNWVKLEEYI